MVIFSLILLARDGRTGERFARSALRDQEMQPMFRRDAAGSHLIELALPFPKSQIEYLSNDHGGETNEKSNLDDGFPERDYAPGYNGAGYSPLSQNATHVGTPGAWTRI